MGEESEESFDPEERISMHCGAESADGECGESENGEMREKREGE